MTELRCPSCAARNRVAAVPRGVSRCTRVNVDEEPALGARFHAHSIPLLVVLRDGYEVDRIVGALPRQTLESRLAPFLDERRS